MFFTTIPLTFAYGKDEIAFTQNFVNFCVIKKTNLYLLTERGLVLTPLLVELASWSDKNLRDIHPDIVNGEAIEFLRSDKSVFASALIEKYRGKLASLVHLN